MKKEEFEAYLKSIGGLENGFRAEPNRYSEHKDVWISKFNHNCFCFMRFFSVPDRQNPFRSRIYSKGFFAVGEGWIQLVKNCIEELIAIGWDKQVCQVKEKFGGLRFYTNALPEEGHEIIRKYEDLSYDTCEKCGTTENIGHTTGWVLTLCEGCSKDKKGWKPKKD